MSQGALIAWPESVVHHPLFSADAELNFFSQQQSISRLLRYAVKDEDVFKAHAWISMGKLKLQSLLQCFANCYMWHPWRSLKLLLKLLCCKNVVLPWRASKLSWWLQGGQAQRVTLAICLALKPEILLLDGKQYFRIEVPETSQKAYLIVLQQLQSIFGKGSSGKASAEAEIDLSNYNYSSSWFLQSESHKICSDEIATITVADVYRSCCIMFKNSAACPHLNYFTHMKLLPSFSSKLSRCQTFQYTRWCRANKRSRSGECPTCRKSIEGEWSSSDLGDSWWQTT